MFNPDDEKNFPLDRTSKVWQDAYALLAYDPPRARRYADMRARVAAIEAAKISGATGVFPTGLGEYVALRDGVELSHYPARSAEEAQGFITYTDPDAVAERAVVKSRDEEIARLRDELSRVRNENASLRGKIAVMRRRKGDSR
jgi:hypothetical protein